MPLNVICPGCLKRFQIGIRFAGMKGPCPNCGTIISIPLESMKIHNGESTGSGKEKQWRQLLRPIPRQDMEFDPAQAGRYALGVLGVLLFTFILGCLPLPTTVRLLMGILGLCLVVFPLSLFGYHILRDRELIFTFESTELHRRAGIVSAGYVILWFGLEFFLSATQANGVVNGIYLTAFAMLATLLVHPLLELETRNAFLHFCIFAFSVVLLRFLLGFGWLWKSEVLIPYTVAPPPPFLPGM